MINLFVLGPLVASVLMASGGNASGTLTIQGNNIELKHVYAQQLRGDAGGTGRPVQVVITDRPVPEEARNDTGAMMDLYGAGQLHGVKVEYTPDGSSVSIVFMSNLIDGSISFSQGGSDVRPKVFTATRIENTLDLSERKTGDTSIALKASFAADVAPYVEEPEPTPADAAAARNAPQTKVYLALLKAVHAGDKAGIMAHVDPERRAMVDTPEFPELLKMIQGMTPKQVKVLKLTESGDKSVLLVEAKNEEGGLMRGKITLTKGPGGWFVSRESWGE